MKPFTDNKHDLHPSQRFRFFLKAAIIFSSITLLIYGTLLMPVVQDNALRIIIHRLNKQFSGHISVESMRMNGEFTIEIRKIKWSNHHSMKKPFLLCKKASLQFNLFKLIRHQFPFTRISADSLWIDDRLLHQFSTGHTPNLSSDRTPSRSWPVQDCLFEISNGSWVSQSQTTLLQGQIRMMNGYIHFAEAQPQFGRIRIENIEIGPDSSAIPLGGLFFHLDQKEMTRYGQLDLIHEKTRFNAAIEWTQNQALSGEWQFLDRGYLLSVLPPFSTYPLIHCSAHGHVSGRLDSLMTHSVIYPGGAVPLMPDSVTLTGTLLPGLIHNIVICIPWLDGQIRFAGNLGIDSSRTSNCTLIAEMLSVSQFWQSIRGTSSPFTGQVLGQISAQGPGLNISQWKGSGCFRIENITHRRDPAASLTARLMFSPDSLRLSARQGTTDITGQIQTPMSEPKGWIRIQNLRTGLLAPWIHLSGFQGSMNGLGTIRGSWRNPEMRFNVSSKRLRFRFMKIDTCFIDITYKDNTFDLKTARLIAHSDTLSDQPDTDEPFLGDLKLRMHMSGLSEDLKGDCHLHGRIGNWHGWHSDTLSIQAHIHERTLLTTALITSDSSTAKLEGQIGWQPLKGQMEMRVSRLKDSTSSPFIVQIDTIHGWRFQTKGSGLSMADLSPFHSAFPSIQGRLTLSGHYKPSSRVPSGLLLFQGTDLKLSENETGLATGRLNYQKGSLNFKTAVSCGPDSLQLSGNVRHKSGPQPSVNIPFIDAKVSSHVHNITPYIQHWAPQIQMQGTLLTDLKITGPFDNLGMDGNVRLMGGQLKWSQQLEVAADTLALLIRFQGDSLNAKITGHMKNRWFTLQGHILHFLRSSPTWQVFWQSDSSQLDYKGRMDDKGWKGNFQASNFDLRLLQPIFPSLYGLDGLLHAQFAFQPNTGRVFENGYIDIKNLTFSVPEIPVYFSRGFLHAKLSEYTIDMDSLSFHMNGGDYIGKGEYAHRNFQFFTGISHLRGGKSGFKKSGVYKILLDSLNMMLASNNMQHQLSGHLTLGESQFRQSIRLRDIPAWLNRTHHPWHKPSEFQKNIQINIRVRNLKPFWIDNNLTRIKINSELGLYGSLASPYFMGNLTVKEGYILYLDRKFEVKEGNLIFSNPESPYPEIDFLGEKIFYPYETYSRKKYVISLNVSGPVNHVRIQWQSEPHLTEADILALLTLGATRHELTKENSQRWGTQFTDVLQDRLALISSQQISTYTTKTLGNIFGLESVSLEGNLFKFNKRWGPQLLASKKLSGRLMLTYRTSVGKSNAQEVRLNYQLTKKMSLEGQTDQEGESGIDILYQHKF